MTRRELHRSLVFRMGMLRGALFERMKKTNELLHFADRLESLAVGGQGTDQDGVEAALDELEALAGVGANQGRKRATREQETAPG